MTPTRGRRRGDPDHPGLLFAVSMVIKRWPIHTGLLLALLVVGPITVINLKQWQRISAQNETIQHNRVAVVNATCRAINTLARANNGQTVYIEGLILSGPQQSRPFNALLKRYGAPSYHERLRRAHAVARGLRRLALPAIDCPEFADAIRELEGGPLIIPYDRPRFPETVGVDTGARPPAAGH